VTCNDGKICLKAINTLDKNIELDIPTLTIHEVEKMGELTNKNDNKNDEIVSEADSTRDFSKDDRRIMNECWKDICKEQNRRGNIRLEPEEYMEIVESIIEKGTRKDKTDEPQPGCSWQTEILNINNEVMEIPVDLRSTKLKDLLRLEHLNSEEQSHVQNLIQRYENLFKLPEESLTKYLIIIPVNDQINHNILVNSNI
jgi:hypothetical protein